MPVTNQTRPTAQVAPTKGEYDCITLLPSGTLTAITTVNGTNFKLPRPSNGLIVFVDLTAAATLVGDTLDVKIQTLIDGTTWVDTIHFTQLLGNGGAKQLVAKLTTNAAEAMYTYATLAAGSIKNIFGDEWRVVTTVAGSGGQSFTLSVTAVIC